MLKAYRNIKSLSWRIEAWLHSTAPTSSLVCLAILSIALVSYTSKIQAKTRQATMCLAENIYHEGRGEPLKDKYLIGLITLARVTDPDPEWPKTICGAIAQNHAYSWVLHYKLATERNEPRQWAEAEYIARDLIANAWSKYKLPPGWGCVRYYKVKTDKNRFFSTKLVPVGSFGKQEAYRARKMCKVPMPTEL